MSRGISDSRGESNLIEKVLAIKLVLASQDLTMNSNRLIKMVGWILNGDEPPPGANHLSTRLFVDAIKATK